QALVARLFELLPEIAHAQAPHFRTALLSLGQRIEQLAPPAPPASPPGRAARAPEAPPRTLAEFFAEVSTQRPLLIEVDNLEDADDASQGLLASLATLAERYPILLLTAEARRGEQRDGIGLSALRRHSRTLELAGLSELELLELLRSIFADAPNLERF